MTDAAPDNGARELLRVAVIRAVAKLDGYKNPNTARGHWWDKRVAPVMAAILANGARFVASPSEARREVEALPVIVVRPRSSARGELVSRAAVLAILDRSAPPPEVERLREALLFVLKATHPIGGTFFDMPASNVERVCEVVRVALDPEGSGET